MATCRACGLVHRHPADAWACDAIHGRARAWPAGIRDPMCACELCGHVEPLSELLQHFRWIHGRESVSTGSLVRYVRDTRDVSEWP